MRYLFALGACALLLAGCDLLTPEQAESAIDSLRDDLSAGRISQAQFDAWAEMLRDRTGVDWGRILEVGGGMLLAVVGSLTGVRLQRGSINARRGKAPVGAA